MMQAEILPKESIAAHIRMLEVIKHLHQKLTFWECINVLPIEFWAW